MMFYCKKIKVAELLWRVRNLYSNHAYMIFCYFNTYFRKRKGEKAQKWLITTYAGIADAI